MQHALAWFFLRMRVYGFLYVSLYACMCVCMEGCVLFVDYINAIEMHLRGIEIEIEVENEIAWAVRS